MDFSLSQRKKKLDKSFKKGKIVQIEREKKMNLGRAAAQNGEWKKAYEIYSTGDESVENLIQSVICALKLYKVNSSSKICFLTFGHKL